MADANAARAAAERGAANADAARATAERGAADADAARIAAEAARAQADAGARRREAGRAQADAARVAAEQQAQGAAAQSEQEKAALRERLRVQLNVILETRETARGLIVNLSDVLFDTGSANAEGRRAREAGARLGHPRRTAGTEARD